jgi:hypothetical protein
MSALHVLVRVWTYLYTFALPSEIRDRRRAEIESDLWESEHDPDVPHHAFVLRLLRGLPADLLWRLEVTSGRHHARAAVGAVAGAGVLAVALWAFVRQPVLPVPPRRPVRISLGLMPPPPPPPPPRVLERKGHRSLVLEEAERSVALELSSPR